MECKLREEVTFYIGYTNNIKDRVLRHKSKKVISTKKYDSVRLIYFECCLDKRDAILREKSLKTGFGRGFVKNRLKYYLQTRD
ncbi:GIY-YIG nuclease family protein [Candidatus Shapirobacteria bacterium]|nr:GIY-YIG nuclease family protein [Candidatus Shapirobacteria bacterium]